MLLVDYLSCTWHHIQSCLFPWLTEEVGPLTEAHRKLIATLEILRVEGFVGRWRDLPGRPPHDRAALARAFVAKAVMQIPTTVMVLERLQADRQLRRLCGWESAGQLPSEATFSRGFAEFARSALPGRVHEALIKRTHEERIVGHISRDATAIEAREKPVTLVPPQKPKRQRGRPRKGEVVEKEAKRLERQGTMSLTQMLADLPTHCAVVQQAKCERAYRQLDRLQAASRCCRRRDPHQRPADLGLLARQPGGHPARCAVGRARYQSI